MGLLHENGLIGRMPLFYTLNFMQSILLLTVYTATARLLRTHAVFPLVITLAHCLYMTHTGGAALRGLVGPMPYGLTASSLLLAAGAAFCLWRFRSLLAQEPELWALPRQEKMSETETEPELSHEARLTAFAAAYGFSKQETMVMNMLAQKQSTKKIADALAVDPDTVRTYVRRLMHKTGTKKRTGLMERYAAHSSPMAFERPNVP